MYFKDERIIPEAEHRAKVLELGHRGHQGEVRTTSRICMLYWWPRINNDVRDFVRSCEFCSFSDRTTRVREPELSVEEYPERAWERMGMDLAGPFAHGEFKFLFVCQDYFTKFPFVILMEEIGRTIL